MQLTPHQAAQDIGNADSASILAILVKDRGGQDLLAGQNLRVWHKKDISSQQHRDHAIEWDLGVLHQLVYALRDTMVRVLQ